eukprot:TRINITY_DN7754_c0_g1_i11.p1 TRINITY_DN7754_c0_g1~~TRINITY_DN7754_c0_g1_i11.p1  ORF type:complete len:234 (-),score=44.77 TRINITY_DN7754_c0_g1_i11:154-855(-)
MLNYDDMPKLSSWERSNYTPSCVAPLAIAFRNCGDTPLYHTIYAAFNSSSFSKDVIDAACIHGLAIKELCLLDDPYEFKPKQFIQGLVNSSFTPVMRYKLSSILTLMSKLRGPDKDAPDVFFLNTLSESTRKSTCEATAVSLWYFVRYFKDPVECLSRAVTGGGDTDVVGIMVGALVGSLHGTSWFPTAWFNALENIEPGREVIITLARNLVELNFEYHSLPRKSHEKMKNRF